MPRSREESHFFVTVNKPNSPPNAGPRKEVRSWVTSIQHSRKRNRDRDEQREDAAGTPEDEEAPHPIGFGESSAADPLSSKTITRRERAAPSIESAPSEAWNLMPSTAFVEQAHVSTTRRQQRSQQERQRKSLKHAISTTDELVISSESPHPRIALLSAQTSKIVLSNELPDPTDTLSVYAQQLNIEASTLWAHYLWQEREHGRIFRAQYGGSRFSGMASRFLHPLILSNPAMLATTVLFTACHLRYMRCQTVLSPPILRVRSLAYNFVQNAIDSDAEQLSDATFLAIIKLALFEVVFGQWAAYRIHMRGITQMLRLRKGLSNLGPDGYVGCLLAWFDANLSAVTDMPRFLAEEASTAALESAEPDVETFVLGVKPLLQLDDS